MAGRPPTPALPRKGGGSCLPALFLALALLLPAAAHADENSDLNLIPPNLATPGTTPPAPASAAPSASQANVYLENDVTGSPMRAGLPVEFPGTSETWQERVFLDARGSFAFSDAFQAVYSFRMNAQAENDIDNPGPHTVRLDSRELYGDLQPAAGWYFDFGRINVKNGVASGYNPTDFFDARAVVDPNTLDPQVLREDRLGTVMVRGQHLWAGGSASLLYAPRLESPAPLRDTAQLPRFDPLFDQTNTTDRWLATVSAKVTDDLTPELLVYHAAAETRIGANIAQSVGRATVLYAEWSGGWEPGLAAQAVEFAGASGMVSPETVTAAGLDERRAFNNDLAVGGTYTTGNKVSMTLEYELHQAGLTSAQLRGYYTAAANGNALAGQAMWLIRGYAGDQQQPLGRQEAFFRVSWNDAFVRDLELDAFTMVSLQDGSALGQVSATYDLSDRWRLGAVASATTGGRRSEFGGQATAGSVIFKVARWF